MTLSKSDRPIGMSFQNGDNDSNIESQLKVLGKQLISFTIIDRQGISRGKVKDIYYDANNELNLLVELTKTDRKISWHRLRSIDICQLKLEDKLILSNLSDRQLEQLPLYQPVPPHLKEVLTKSNLYDDCKMNPAHNDIQQSDSSEITQIPLLEEKLQIARRKRKIGEVIVRKEVETQIVKVPIRREKLIIESIGNNPERLTEVVIAEEKVNGFKYQELNHSDDSLHITKSHFLDVTTAQELLEAVAYLSSAKDARVRLEIVTNCSEHQIEHQNICDRYQ